MALAVSLLHCLVDRTASGMACRVEPCVYLLKALLMYDIVFYSGKVMGELRIQLYRLSTMCTITVKMAVQHFYWL